MNRAVIVLACISLIMILRVTDNEARSFTSSKEPLEVHIKDDILFVYDCKIMVESTGTVIHFNNKSELNDYIATITYECYK